MQTESILGKIISQVIRPRSFMTMPYRRIFQIALFSLFMLNLPMSLSPALAYPTKEPVIEKSGKRCVFISTAGVDHGEKVAQKYADDLLKADIAQFKKSKKLKTVRISSRFRKCKFHLWFFGNEYNCTSRAKICW